MELEFRAWTYHDGWSDGIMVTQTLENEENGYLCMNVQKVVYLSDKYKEQNGEIVEVSQWEECNDTIIMQYTGRKDNNGKKIFDGDIIEFDLREWGGTDNIHIVSWDNENSCWDWGGGSSSDMEFRVIIGNIYEHPHLIEKHGN